MILENNKGRKKDVDVIMIIKKNTKEYLLYSCDDLFLHVGLRKKDKLIPLKEQEFEFISEILNKMNI